MELSIKTELKINGRKWDKKIAIQKNLLKTRKQNLKNIITIVKK